MNKDQKKILKNVGILTFHYSNHNYGALLQTFASVVNLRKAGLNPIVVNLCPPKSYFKNVSVFRMILNLIIPNTFNKFRKKYLPLTPKIDTATELQQLNKNFDAFYVGSDQIWRPGFTNENLYHYFLDFVEDEKLKISYAPSFGHDEVSIPADDVLQLKKLVHRFNAVSVREESAVKICKEVLNVEAVHVLDPTLLLTANDYLNSIKISNKESETKYIAYYQLSSVLKISTPALEIKSKIGIPEIKNIYLKSFSVIGINITWFNKVENWLYSIKNAAFVVTDSYHCIIFSIIFKRQFICILNKHNGNTRIESLLKQLDLIDRIYTENSTENIPQIDYDLVYSKLNVLKKESNDFLVSAFKNL